jgi:hypothetical protein
VYAELARQLQANYATSFASTFLSQVQEAFTEILQRQMVEIGQMGKDGRERLMGWITDLILTTDYQNIAFTFDDKEQATLKSLFNHLGEPTITRLQCFVSQQLAFRQQHAPWLQNILWTLENKPSDHCLMAAYKVALLTENRPIDSDKPFRALTPEAATSSWLPLSHDTLFYMLMSGDYNTGPFLEWLNNDLGQAISTLDNSSFFQRTAEMKNASRH